MIFLTVPAAGTDAQNQVSPPKKTLGQEEFLNLLITQMRFQDPLKPMENTEFTAQLAQFSSLDQLFNINDQLSGLTGSQQTLGNTQAVGFIGQEVRATSDHLYFNGREAAVMGYRLDHEASGVQIRIFDENGIPVRDLTVEGGPQGRYELTWDGLNDRGRAVSPGDYTFTVSATDSSGSQIPVSPFVSGTVSGISYADGGPYLIVNNQLIPIQDVTEVETSL